VKVKTAKNHGLFIRCCGLFTVWMFAGQHIYFRVPHIILLYVLSVSVLIKPLNGIGTTAFLCIHMKTSNISWKGWRSNYIPGRCIDQTSNVVVICIISTTECWYTRWGSLWSFWKHPLPLSSQTSCWLRHMDHTARLFCNILLYQAELFHLLGEREGFGFYRLVTAVVLADLCSRLFL